MGRREQNFGSEGGWVLSDVLVVFVRLKQVRLQKGPDEFEKTNTFSNKKI